MNIETERIKLRKLRISDADFIRQNAEDRKITKYTNVVSSSIGARNAEKFIKRIQKEWKKKTAFEFGIELKKSKKLIGAIDLSDIDCKNKNASVGFWLVKKYWSKGLAEEALRLILSFGFKKLKLKRIQARVFHKNKNAQKLLEKLGFKLEGRLRKKTFFRNQWFDDLIYGILKDEY
ncbi:MAG: GNAT family N-acetyltransferase [Candidatus Pacebacteria bacterium]|nr:GNAT family N-acetyltransferase [Candidatus Paceibacterota bacterium]